MSAASGSSTQGAPDRTAIPMNRSTAVGCPIRTPSSDRHFRRLIQWRIEHIPRQPGALDARQPRELFGHPRGLVVLAGTEFWDRISFHGMQALLTLYMAEQLLLPGHIEHVAGFAAYRSAIESVTGPLSIRALATQTFGLYVGFI